MNFEWKNEYCLGLDELDVQHKRFLNLIQMLYLADESSRHDLLKEISRYASYHFASEEEMMNQYGYKEVDTHAMEHKFLKVKVVEALFDSQKEVFKFEEFIMFLVKWFIDHTTVTDKNMSYYILDKRI